MENFFFNKYVYLQQKGAIYANTYIIYTTLPTITAIGPSGDLQTIYNTLKHFIQNCGKHTFDITWMRDSFSNYDLWKLRSDIAEIQCSF